VPELFDAATRDLLAGAREVDIETTRHEGAPVHRTTIWVLVDDRGRVLVRSVNGGSARWFREAVANPRVALHVGGRTIPATALVANDPDRIEAASEGYVAKYGRSSSARAMIKERILSTTLELVPR
jgi:hypothetical protein